MCKECSSRESDRVKCSGRDWDLKQLSWSRVRAKNSAALLLCFLCVKTKTIRSHNFADVADAAPCGHFASLVRSASPARLPSEAKLLRRISRELTDSPPELYFTCFCLFCMVETLIHFFVRVTAEADTDIEFTGAEAQCATSRLIAMICPEVNATFLPGKE